MEKTKAIKFIKHNIGRSMYIFVQSFDGDIRMKNIKKGDQIEYDEVLSILVNRTQKWGFDINCWNIIDVLVSMNDVVKF